MRANNASEFETLLAAVAADSLDAIHHRTLYKGLIEAKAEYAQEYAQTPTFWWLTVRAHSDVVLYRLARLYDKRQDSLCLHSWLKLIEDNGHLFTKRAFRQRLAKNPHVDDLAKEDRTPNEEQLELDIASVSATDPVVSRFIHLRNVSLAHRDAAVVLAGGLANDTGPTWQDIDQLIERAMTIVNRYSNLFRASTYSPPIVGQEDYEFLLKMVRGWLAAEEERIQSEVGQSNNR